MNRGITIKELREKLEYIKRMLVLICATSLRTGDKKTSGRPEKHEKRPGVVYSFFYWHDDYHTGIC